MAINRSQLAKELEPGLNALFGMEYARPNDCTPIHVLTDSSVSGRLKEEIKKKSATQGNEGDILVSPPPES